MWIAAIVISSIAVFIYAVQILRYGLEKACSIDVVSDREKNFPFISVVVPFRNEKKNLAALIEDLKQQKYSKELYEVIFVDDHSEDASPELLIDLIHGCENFYLLQLSKEEGKKQAIDAGVLRARGSWVLQIDADCRMGSKLISEYAFMVSSKEYCFVAGPVGYIKAKGLWNKIETLEFLSLSGSGMFSFCTGRAVMCNGANMAYQKEFYMLVRESLLAVDSPSGDDVFLLLEAKKRKEGVAFLYSREAMVQTYPSGNIASFLKQRLRWGSKSKVYKDKDLIFLALIVYLANLSLTTMFVMMFFAPQGWILFAALWLAKLLADLVLMRRVLRFFDRRELLWLFPLTALFYYFYIAIIGPVSLLSGFHWKGRDFGSVGMNQ